MAFSLHSPTLHPKLFCTLRHLKLSVLVKDGGAKLSSLIPGRLSSFISAMHGLSLEITSQERDYM